MTDQTRSEQSADIAARADERALGAQRDIIRVERSLTDQIEEFGNELREAMKEGFKELALGQSRMTDEIVLLKIENAARTRVERFAKWLLTIALTVALSLLGIFYTGYHTPPPQH